MSHTPGPWGLEDNKNNTSKWIFSIKTGSIVCRFEHDEINHENNSKLIAAAPEMFEAIGNALTALEQLHHLVVNKDQRMISANTQAELIRVMRKAGGWS